jgi:hypothetical protein
MRLLEFGFYCAALILVGIRALCLTLLNGWFRDPRFRAVPIGDDALDAGENRRLADIDTEKVDKLPAGKARDALRKKASDHAARSSLR